MTKAWIRTSTEFLVLKVFADSEDISDMEER